MHELALAQEILDVVAARSGGARVTRVVLEVGKLAAVLPDALRFCFDLAAEDTVARGASLEIVETPGRARCRGCGADVALDSIVDAGIAAYYHRRGIPCRSPRCPRRNCNGKVSRRPELRLV